MGISRDHRRGRDGRERRDTLGRVEETGVALDVVAGTWADPTGSYYEAAMGKSLGKSMGKSMGKWYQWIGSVIGCDWFMGKSMEKSRKNMDPTIKIRSFL